LLGAPHLVWAPAGLIFSMVLGFNVLGSAISSYLDTKR